MGFHFEIVHTHYSNVSPWELVARPSHKTLQSVAQLLPFKERKPQKALRKWTTANYCWDGPFSGTTRVSRCQKRTSVFYGARGVAFSTLTLLVGQQEGHPARKKYGGWWRWALVSPDGVAPSRMVGLSASVNLPLHRKVQKFSSGTGSSGWSRKKAIKLLWLLLQTPESCLFS